MKRALGLVVLALALAGSAHAAAKGGALAAGGRTIAGPASASVGAAGTLEVFLHSGGGAPDACVTVVNTGRTSLNVEVSGATTPIAAILAGGSQALCVQDLTGVELACPGEQACSAQWRVDLN